MTQMSVRLFAINGGTEHEIVADDLKIVLPNGVEVMLSCEPTPDGYVSLLIPATEDHVDMFAIRPGAVNQIFLSAQSHTPAVDDHDA